MGMTFDNVKTLLDTEQLNYFIHPNAPTAMFRLNGSNGSLGLIVSLQMNGEFLKIASFDYAKCPSDSLHVPALLRLLNELNAGIRWIKWSWDPQDGDISVQGDMWVMDNQPTQKQFRRMLENIIPSLEEHLPRINHVIQTGQDTGINPPSAAAPKTVDTL